MIYKITLPGRTLPLFFKTLAAAARHEEVAKRVNYQQLISKTWPHTTKHGVVVEAIDLPNDITGVWIVDGKDHFANALDVLFALLNRIHQKDFIGLVKFLENADLKNPTLYYTCDSFKLLATEITQ